MHAGVAQQAGNAASAGSAHSAHSCRRTDLVGVARLHVGGDVRRAAIDVGADPVKALARLQRCAQGRFKWSVAAWQGPGHGRSGEANHRRAALLAQSHDGGCARRGTIRRRDQAAADRGTVNLPPLPALSTHRPGGVHPVVVVLQPVSSRRALSSGTPAHDPPATDPTPPAATNNSRPHAWQGWQMALPGRRSSWGRQAWRASQR